MASMLVPYWFSLYSPCSMNLQIEGVEGQHKNALTCTHRTGNVLIVQHVCIKLLLGDKMVLHALLLVRLLGSGGVCGNTQH